MNSINSQLKGINIILNTLNEDIKKIKEKVNNLLLKENKNNENNYIIAEINISFEYITDWDKSSLHKSFKRFMSFSS